MTSRADLLDALKNLESRISEQVREVEVTRAQIQQIKAQLLRVGEARELAVPYGGSRTSEEKVALFRSLFRGREDVYGSSKDPSLELPFLQG